jgi:hypothetical protein
MNAGQCVEFGTPHELLQTSEGPKIFYDMVKQTGKGTFEQLSKVAEEVRAVYGNSKTKFLTNFFCFQAFSKKKKQ